MRPIPLFPASRACQFSAVPTPRGEMRPTPVRATRRGSVFKAGSFLRLGRARDLVLVPGVVLDVVHGLADVADLLGLLVGDLDPELLLEGHHQLHDVQGVGPQILGEARVQGDFFLVDPELLDDDALDLICNCHRWFPPGSMVSRPGARPRTTCGSNTKALRESMGRGQIYNPPDTFRVWPVMYPASSLARKRTAAATSSTVPRRLRAMAPVSDSREASGSAWVIAVSM